MIRLFCLIWLASLILFYGAPTRPVPRPLPAYIKRKVWIKPVGRRVLFVGYVRLA